MNIYVVGSDSVHEGVIAETIGELGFALRAYADEADFIARATSLDPGIVLFHVRIEDRAPADCVRLLREKCRSRHVAVILSSPCDVCDAVAAMREGAADFLEAPFRRRELTQALLRAKTVLQRRLHSSRRRAQDRVLRQQLTPAEVSVLQASSEGQTGKEVATKLGLSVRTVEMHRSRIINKLDVCNFAGALVLAEGACLLDHTREG